MRPDVHLQPGCPWWSLSEWRRPNVDWCELQQCAWVVEPANTWSNLAYVLVGLGLFIVCRRSTSAQLRFFAPAAIVVGLASGIYHASYTFVLQILDFAGMYVFTYLLLTVNLRRLGVLGSHDWFRRFWQLVLGTTLLTVGLDFLSVPIQLIMVFLIVMVVATEWRLAARGPAASRGCWWLGLALLAAAGVFSLLDVTRTWCDPTHPYLQGHAIWHVLSALSLFVLYFHYRQFEGVLADSE